VEVETDIALDPFIRICPSHSVYELVEYIVMGVSLETLFVVKTLVVELCTMCAHDSVSV
jgi:hypothetical protein